MTDLQSKKIQIIRGIAIIAVILIHCAPHGLPQVFIRPFLNFSVGAFLFLSGMLSSREKWHPKKRIKKVAVPYILWSVIYTFIYNIDRLSEIPVLLAKNLAIGGAAATMYYIFVYCEFTLLIPLIDKIARSKYKWLGFAVSPLEIILVRLLPLLIGLQPNKYISAVITISCLGWFTYYYLGYLIGNKLIKINYKKSTLIAAYLLSLLAQILEGFWLYKAFGSNYGSQLKIGALLSGAIFCLLAYYYITGSKKSDFIILKTLGDNSFGIYFSHLAVLSVLNKIPYFKSIAIFPVNGIIVIVITMLCVSFGKKLLGKYGKYLAL